jgi:hypothetical protein
MFTSVRSRPFPWIAMLDIVPFDRDHDLLVEGETGNVR